MRRSRVRGLAARFESRLRPQFKRRAEEVGRLLPELCVHGLVHDNFDRALRGPLGAGAPLSAASIARLKAGALLAVDCDISALHSHLIHISRC